MKHLGLSVFNIKKKHSRTISNLLSSWMFTLYSNYNFNDDPFFPTDFIYFDNLKNTLHDYTSIYNIKDATVKINNIIDNYLVIIKILINLNKFSNINDNNIIISKHQILKK